MNIIYLRVSKEDESKQDPEQQLLEIKQKFKLNDYVLYQERGTAYDLSKIHKRQEFFKILNLCYDSAKVTIDDIFMGNLVRKDINIYVWDYARIIRNIELSILFQLLATWHNVQIHSYKDMAILKRNSNETPTARLTRIMMNTISAFSSEEYSYTISTNVKKAFTKIKNSTYSKDGKKVGKKFVNPAGEYVILSPSKENKMYDFIVDSILDYETRKVSCYYPIIITKVKNEFNIVVSPAYISQIKTRLMQNG